MMAKAADEIKITQNRIVKIESDRASNQGRIGEHQRKAVEAADEAAKFVADAATNEKALDKHLKANSTEEFHLKQIRILQNTDGDLHTQLSEAHKKLEQLRVKESQETLAAQTGPIRAIANKMSQALAGVAADCAQLDEQMRTLTANSIATFADSTRFSALQRSMRESVINAIRAELQNSFGEHGFVLFDSRRYEGQNFVSIMEKPLNDLSAALESSMHADTPVPGRAMFRARTVISGLHGMSLNPGDVISLEVGNPDVRRMIDAGGLEEISETKEATA
jgi:hypothetical protein